MNDKTIESFLTKLGPASYLPGVKIFWPHGLIDIHNYSVIMKLIDRAKYCISFHKFINISRSGRYLNLARRISF
jgi:hypothetical protein